MHVDEHIKIVTEFKHKTILGNLYIDRQERITYEYPSRNAHIPTVGRINVSIVDVTSPH